MNRFGLMDRLRNHYAMVPHGPLKLAVTLQARLALLRLEPRQHSHALVRLLYGWLYWALRYPQDAALQLCARAGLIAALHGLNAERALFTQSCREQDAAVFHWTRCVATVTADQLPQVMAQGSELYILLITSAALSFTQQGPTPDTALQFSFAYHVLKDLLELGLTSVADGLVPTECAE